MKKLAIQLSNLGTASKAKSMFTYSVCILDVVRWFTRLGLAVVEGPASFDDCFGVDLAIEWG